MKSRNQLQALITKALDGDRASFNLLIQLQEDELVHYVQMRLGTHLRKYVEVDDVLQEAYARAFQSIRTFKQQDEKAFLQWLRRIVENVILEYARKQQRNQVLFLDRDVAGSDPSPSKNMIREERFNRFKQALQSLPQDYREVILLSRIEGLRIKEISERMNRSPKAIAHLLSRAMAKMKEVFGETESYRLSPHQLDDQVFHDG